MYKFAAPDDGFAYSPIELDAIFHIKVEGVDYRHGPMAQRWEFFGHMAGLPKNPDRLADQAIQNMITTAILSEVEDPEPDNLGLLPPDSEYLIPDYLCAHGGVHRGETCPSCGTLIL